MNKQIANKNLANEVLDFLSKQESKKTVRCQCGRNFQIVGMLCNYCGDMVQDEI